MLRGNPETRDNNKRCPRISEGQTVYTHSGNTPSNIVIRYCSMIGVVDITLGAEAAKIHSFRISYTGEILKVKLLILDRGSLRDSAQHGIIIMTVTLHAVKNTWFDCLTGRLLLEELFTTWHEPLEYTLWIILLCDLPQSCVILSPIASKHILVWTSVIHVYVSVRQTLSFRPSFQIPHKCFTH